MPPRHSRNARKIKDTNAYTHPVISQQPTPSPRPSPDIYPIALPETTTSRGRPPGPGPGSGLGTAAVLPTPTQSLSEERGSRLLTPPLPEPEPSSVVAAEPMRIEWESLDVGFGGREAAVGMVEEYENQRPLLDLDMDEMEENGTAAHIRAPSLLGMESEPESSVPPPPAILGASEPQHVAFTPAPSPSPPRAGSPVPVSAPSLPPGVVHANPPPRVRSPDLVRATSSPRFRTPDLARATPPPRVRSPDLVRASSPRAPSPSRVPSSGLARASSSPPPVPAFQPPAPSPPTSPRTAVRSSKASVAASSPKTPNTSQTLTIPIPPTAAGVSPPAVSKPVSFGRFTGTGVAGSNLGASSGSGSSSAMGEPVDLEGTIRPRRRQPTHSHGTTEEEDHHPRPRRQQPMPSDDPYGYAQRRMSYGQGYYDNQQQHRDRGGSLPMMHPLHQQHEQYHRTRTRSGISQAMNHPNPNHSNGSSSSDYDTIISARWDMGMRGKRLLMVGYHPLGIQVWDCARLDEVTEELNLPSLSEVLGGDEEQEWEFVHAGVLGEGLIGVLVSPKTTWPPPARNVSTKSSRLIVYSLPEHALVKQVTVPGLASGGGRFEIGSDVVVVSTTHPPALHVLSMSTFEVLHKIPAAELALFCAPPHHLRPADDSRRNSLMSSMYSTSTGPFDAYAPFDDAERIELTPPQPAPVYSISGRLLAYASGGEQTSHHVIGSGTAASTSTASAILSQGRSASIAALASFSEQIANLNRGGAGGAGVGGGGIPGTSTDLGHAAMRVGGGLLSGMKSLGGMAYKGAVNASNSGGGGSGGIGAFANRFFSKSAPAATASVVTSHGGVDEGGRGGDASATDIGILGRSSSGSVTVLDLDALKDKNHTPTSMVITRFIATTSQPIADIWFSQDGTSVMVAPKDGQVVHVYGIRSNPVARVQARDEVDEAGNGSPKSRSSFSMIPDAPPSHVYDLRRGRTPGVVESASWSLDQRWVAFGTRKRTVHVFAVNPYGGKSDVRSHLEGIVRNYTEMPPLSAELSPLVRLRVTRHPGPDQPKVPLAFTFLDSPCLAESTMPANLLPAISSPNLLPTTHPHQHSYGSANSNHTVFSSSSPSARSEPISPNRQQSFPGRPKNYQDVLVFDPTDGVLSLRRITVNAKAKSKDNGSSILGSGFGSTAAAGAVSISRSLPGMSAMGKLAMSVSVSPTTPAIHGRVSSPGQTQTNVDSALAELSGKESTIATWNLGRRKDWGEVKRQWEEPAKHPVAEGGVKGKTTTKPNGQADWLAQAELSTFSKSTRVLPRSIYLTHQFSFHALDEDYHALIRRYQFDIPGSKIEVRKGVEVSAYPTGAGTGESFVEGGGAFHRRPSSSFDEPLASALAGEVDYTPPQTILPMLPNGHPGSKPRSFKNSIPIRSLGDGMTESLGRFRREINKVRSPRMMPSSDTTSASTSVPLEFDEEDEDFMLKEEGNTSPSGSGSGSEENHPPPTGAGGAGAGTADTWVGDDADTFDHISAVGFLDEEQESMVEASRAKSLKGKKGRKKY